MSDEERRQAAAAMEAAREQAARDRAAADAAAQAVRDACEAAGAHSAAVAAYRAGGGQ